MKGSSQHRHWLLGLAASLLLLAPLVFIPSARAVDAPPGFTVENAFPDATFPADFRPVKILFLPDGRKLILERVGIVYTILQDGTKPADPFIDLTNEVAGLDDLGMLAGAVDPDFSENRWIYLGYTVDPDEDGNDEDPENDRFVRVVRYQTSLADSNVAEPSSRQDLIGATWPLGIPTLHTSHTVGDMRFAQDKSLLISCGEGSHWELIDAGGHDPNAFGPDKTDPSEDIGSFRARSVNSLGGKILRIDKDTGFGLPTNPYWDGDPLSDRSRVWAYGLRNPYRFTIRPGTGSAGVDVGDPGVIYAGDVGCCRYEELNIMKEGGFNWGWPCKHGPVTHYAFPDITETEAGNDSILCGEPLNDENPMEETLPQIWIDHEDGNNSSPVTGWICRAIIGGAFYEGTEYPAQYQGAYFLGGYVYNWIRFITFDADDNVTGYGTFIEDGNRPVNIEADPESGDLFYASWSGHEIRRIRWTGISSADDDPGAGLPPGPAVSFESYPNPFTRTHLIEFDLPEAENVSVSVYDAPGRLVRTLSESSSYPAGNHTIEWDGRDQSGKRQDPGIYFFRVQIGERVSSKKVLLR